MKRVIIFLTAVIMTAVAATGARADFDPDTDYMSIMVQAAVSGDTHTGREAEEKRNEKIDAQSLEYEKISFDDLLLLAKLIEAEAGSEWLPEEWKFCVGEVALNRVESPEFPDSLEAVVYQPGQYAHVNTGWFESMTPGEQSVLIAVRLLEGERKMENHVVFQANFQQGNGVYKACYDSYLGWTYFCSSENMGLYIEG